MLYCIARNSFSKTKGFAMFMLGSRNSSLEKREDISPTEDEVKKIKTPDEAYKLLHRAIPESDIENLIYEKLLEVLKKYLSVVKTREEALEILRKAPKGLYGIKIRPIIKKKLEELPVILEIVRSS